MSDMSGNDMFKKAWFEKTGLGEKCQGMPCFERYGWDRQDLDRHVKNWHVLTGTYGWDGQDLDRHVKE